MGYTHYWHRKTDTIPSSKFELIRNDFLKLLPRLEAAGVQLAGGSGAGDPEISADDICFNGPVKCGHAKNSEISIPWPADHAQGVATGFDDNKKSGSWFAGAVIEKRCCNGDCSYETFSLPRVFELRDYQIRDKKEEGENWRGWFDCCKTAYRPYDLAVNCVLIIAKYHLGSEIEVSSDGETQHWADGRILCSEVLGYGFAFDIENKY